MQLYLNKKLESVFDLNVLDTMIKDMLNDPKFNSIIEKIDSINLVKHTIDPVQVFIDYWNSQEVGGINSDPISPERQQYIKNALYAAKGAPEVFTAIERCFDIKLKWEYNFPRIDVLDLQVVYISPTELFESKLRSLLYHLLYYTELNLYITNLIYPLEGDLINNCSIIEKGFTITRTQWNGTDVF